MSTPKQLAEKIGIEYHREHFAFDPRYWKERGLSPSWDAFLRCTHEICEDSRTLIGHLEYQTRLLKDCEIFLGPEVWENISGRKPSHV